MKKTISVLLFVCFLVPTAISCSPGTASLPTPIVLPPGEGLIPAGALSRVGKGWPADLAISPDGDLLAVGTSVGVYVYRMDTFEPVWAKPAPGAGVVAWSPNGRWLASTSERGLIDLWEARSSEHVRTFENTDAWLPAGPVSDLAWSPDSTTLVSVVAGSSAWGSSMTYWDVHTGASRPAPGFQGDFQSVAWSPDGREIATGSSAIAEESSIVIWDARSGLRKRTYEVPVPGIGSLAWSPDGARLASGSSQGAAILNAVTGWRLHGFQEDFSTHIRVAWSPDGMQLALAGGDSNRGSLNLWDTGSGRLLGEFHGHTTQVTNVAWSPQGETLVTSSTDGTLGVWDVKTRQRRYTLQGFYDRVSPPIWSADSSLLAYRTGNGAVTVWDVGAGMLLRSFEPGQVAAWAPDRNTLAVGEQNGRITLWDVKTGVPTPLVEHGHSGLTGLVWSPDGNRIAATSRVELDHWWIAVLNADTGEDLLQIKISAPRLDDVAWSPDSALLAAGTYSNRKGAVVVWDSASGQRLRELLYGDSGRLESSAAWSPDGKILASSSVKQGMLFWDVATGMPLPAFQTQADAAVWSVAWSPDGSRLASGGWDPPYRLSIWDTTHANRLCILADHDRTVTDLAWSPDGTMLASTSGGTIILWDMNRAACRPAGQAPTKAASTSAPLLLDTPTPAQLPWTSLPKGKLFDPGISAFNDLALSPDREFLALATRDGLSLLRTDTFEEIWTKRSKPNTQIVSLAFSPDGRTLAAGDGYDIGGSTVTLWEVAGGKSSRSFSLHLTNFVRDLAWSPDGRTLAAPEGNGTLVLWDPTTGALKGTFGDNTGPISSLAWSPDGSALAVGDDRRITLWDPITGKLQRTLTEQGHTVTAMAWSPDGNILASGSSDAVILLWDVATGNITRRLPDHVREITGLAFSPDGALLASGSQDHTIILWDPATGKPVDTLKGHASWVNALAWFPDGRTLISASYEGDIIVWPVGR